MTKGFYPRGDVLYFRYYDTELKKPRSMPTPLKINSRDSDLNKWKEEFLYKKHRGMLPSRFVPVICVMSVLDAFNNAMLTKEVAPATVESYQFAIDKLVKYYGNKPVHFFTDKVLKSYTLELKKDGLSQNSVSINTRTLSVIWNAFIKLKYVKENPVTIVPIDKKPPKIIPPSQLNLIFIALKEVNEEAFNVTKLLYLSGLRKSDILTLEWEQIDLETNTMRLWNYKGKRFDVLPILKPLREHLLSFMPKNAKGKMFIYTSTDSFKFFGRVQKILWEEQRYTLHQIRKTFISKLANSGVSKLTTQQLARHKDYRTTLDFYYVADISKMRTEVDTLVDF